MSEIEKLKSKLPNMYEEKFVQGVKSSSEMNNSDNDVSDIVTDARYIRVTAPLITESLEKGCDVMLMPNGDIIITSMQPMTVRYVWDNEKGKMVRATAGRSKRARNSRGDQEELYDFESSDEEVAA